MAQQGLGAGDVGLAADEFDQRQLLQIKFACRTDRALLDGEIEDARHRFRCDIGGDRNPALSALHEGFEAKDAAENRHPVAA